MKRTLHVDPSLATPIWGQIEEQLRLLVASGVLEPGSPLRPGMAVFATLVEDAPR